MKTATILVRNGMKVLMNKFEEFSNFDLNGQIVLQNEKSQKSCVYH
jgi:hypothetical protein